MGIVERFKFEQEVDMQDLGKIKEKFEDFCVGETHQAYESYKFHLRHQELSETIRAYISSVCQLAKNRRSSEIQVTALDKCLQACPVYTGPGLRV